jgi:hypothetical protein
LNYADLVQHSSVDAGVSCRVKTRNSPDLAIRSLLVVEIDDGRTGAGADDSNKLCVFINFFETAVRPAAVCRSRQNSVKRRIACWIGAVSG